MAHRRLALIAFVVAACAVASSGSLLTKVTAIREEGVWIGAGSSSGVREGDEFEVYGRRRVVYLPLAGRSEEVVVEKGVVARLVVRKTFKAQSLCEVVEGKRKDLKVGMTVVRVPPRRRVARNITPYIDDLIPTPNKVVPGQMVRIKCKVTDADDTFHLYTWRASGGRFYPPRTITPHTLWLPPAEPGKYSITVFVRDPKGASTSATCTVEVVEPTVPPAAYRVDAVFSTVRPPFLKVASLDFDGQGRLVLVDPKQRKLVIFDSDGVALRTTLPHSEKRSIVHLRIGKGRYFLSDAAGCCVLIYESVNDVFTARPSLILGAKGTGNGYFQAAPVVDVSPNGRIYCLDPKQGFVQVFKPDGTFLHSIGWRGSGADAFVRPVSLCFDRGGTLYVLDRGRKEIITFKKDIFCGPLALKEPLVDPLWLRYDPVEDRLVVLDAGVGALRILTRKGEEVGRVEGSGLGLMVGARTFAVGPDGSAVVACGDKVLRRYDIKKGTFRGALGIVDLWPLKDVAVQPDGSFFVLFGENRIAHLTDDGWVLSLFGGRGDSESRFRKPVAMDCDNDGNLYVADASTLLVSKFDREGNFQKRFGARGRSRTNRIDSILDIYVVGNRLYILQDRRTYCVFAFTLDGELVARYPSREGRVMDPAAIAVDSHGNTYLFSESPDLLRYDASGLRAGSVAPIRCYFTDMAVDHCGQIVALDEDRPRLVLVDPASGTRFLKLPSTLFARPVRLDLDNFGRVYILDKRTGCVIRLRPVTE